MTREDNQLAQLANNLNKTGHEIQYNRLKVRVKVQVSILLCNAPLGAVIVL